MQKTPLEFIPVGSLAFQHPEAEKDYSGFHEFFLSEKSAISKYLQIHHSTFCSTLKSLRRLNYMKMPLTVVSFWHLSFKLPVIPDFFILHLTHLFFCMSASLDGRNPGGGWCAVVTVLLALVLFLLDLVLALLVSFPITSFLFSETW